MEEIKIRKIAIEDREQWTKLWSMYLDFYGTRLQTKIYKIGFARLLASHPSEYNGLLAFHKGTAIGLAHYLFHRDMWSVANTCYLQDLYVIEDRRGSGVGNSLIDAVCFEAKKAGCRNVYWQTQASNEKAQRLYDNIAIQTEFISYKKQL